jgi:hypothetical protein
MMTRIEIKVQDMEPTVISSQPLSSEQEAAALLHWAADPSRTHFTLSECMPS